MFALGRLLCVQLELMALIYSIIDLTTPLMLGLRATKLGLSAMIPSEREQFNESSPQVLAELITYSYKSYIISISCCYSAK